MAAIVGPGGLSNATQFAVDGLGGPVVAGEHLQHDRHHLPLSSGTSQWQTMEQREKICLIFANRPSNG